VVRMTVMGRAERARYVDRTKLIEARWAARFGERLTQLRAALEPVVGDGMAETSPLFAGLKPYPESWRARVRRPKILPHFPMVLHRGGYPDGS
jgi:hypothetical protein